MWMVLLTYIFDNYWFLNTGSSALEKQQRREIEGRHKKKQKQHHPSAAATTLQLQECSCGNDQYVDNKQNQVVGCVVET